MRRLSVCLDLLEARVADSRLLGMTKPPIRNQGDCAQNGDYLPHQFKSIAYADGKSDGKKLFDR